MRSAFSNAGAESTTHQKKELQHAIELSAGLYSLVPVCIKATDAADKLEKKPRRRD
jgi:hypothetical protein